MANYRFGKHPAKRDYRTLRFKDYVTSKLAAPPASENTLTRVYANLKMDNPTVLFPMDGNDTIGDCTIAALAHAETTSHALLKKKRSCPRVRWSSCITISPAESDSGLNELDVLNGNWRDNPVAHDKIITYVSIDPKNHTHIEQAIHLFGGVYLGFQVQQNCVQEFDAHKPWTPGPLTNDGHAVFAVGYDHSGVTVLTWATPSRGPGHGGTNALTKPTRSYRPRHKRQGSLQDSTLRN